MIGGRSGDHGVGSAAAAAEAGVRVILQQLAGELPALRHGHLAKIAPLRGPANYAQLKEKGVVPYWYVHYGITMSMYYADPDGNQMELQVDAFASSNDANRYTLGPHFEANPIGVEYEPKSDLPVSPIPGTLAH